MKYGANDPNPPKRMTNPPVKVGPRAGGPPRGRPTIQPGGGEVSGGGATPKSSNPGASMGAKLRASHAQFDEHVGRSHVGDTAAPRPKGSPAPKNPKPKMGSFKKPGGGGDTLERRSFPHPGFGRRVGPGPGPGRRVGPRAGAPGKAAGKSAMTKPRGGKHIGPKRKVV